MRRILAGGIVGVVLIVGCVAADAAPLRPIAIQFSNRAADVPGFWDDTIRSEFVEAMNRVATDVSSRWLHGLPVVISSDIRGNWRLIVVDGRLSYGGIAVAGYHNRDARGPFAIFTLNAAGDSVAQIFLDGSHELSEMLVDPSANRFIAGWYAEVADPVVCCHYDLTLSNGAVEPVNDFVLPSWFIAHASGPYDFINSPYVQHPLEVGPDGFKQHR
jgi:hypothetical protein